MTQEMPPTSDALSTGDQAGEAQRLRQFIGWVLIFVLITFLIELGLGLALNSMGLLGLSAVSFGTSLLLLLARYFVGRGYIQAVAVGLTSALLIVGIATSIMLPDMVITISLSPILLMALVLPYLRPRALIVVAAIMVLGSFIIVALFLLVRIAEPLSPLARNLIVLISVPMVMAMIALLLVQFRVQLSRSLATAREANVALNEARAALETQVTERTAALSEALSQLETRAAEQDRLLSELTAQREVIRELSVPVLPVSAHTLVMPLVGALDTIRLAQMRERALQTIERTRARRLLLDLTGVPVVDTQVARGLLDLADAVHLLGARLVLIGIRTEVAQTIVSLGVDLSAIQTRRDLSSALAEQASRTL